jgi:S-adenosylmethionine:tRNA ribosyltransferase-isomerase
VDLSDFDYALPGELIAQEPLERRGESRLMVLDGDRIIHRRFSDLPGLVGKDDVLVLNDSRVIPARIHAKRETGGRVDLLVLGTEGQVAEALVRSRSLRPGETLLLPGGTCTVLERIAGSRYRFDFRFDGGVSALLDKHGEMPTPPYIKKKLRTPERYQTVFAKRPGSVAAPTAGLHFTNAMLDDLREKGVHVAFVTLHIGPATFQPVRVKTVEEHRMEPEYFRIPAETARAINERRGRLVAVGTTTVKALESSAGKDGTVSESEGWSELFIHPGHEFRLRPDGMLTNFHLPRSTLLMLVSALVGRERLLRAYSEAVCERYRFYSFGDAMLCWTSRP